MKDIWMPERNWSICKSCPNKIRNPLGWFCHAVGLFNKGQKTDGERLLQKAPVKCPVKKDRVII
jgi:hypothetical protein